MIEQSCIRLAGHGNWKRRGGSAARSPGHRHAAILRLLTKVLPVARVGNFACSSYPFDQFNGDWEI